MKLTEYLNLIYRTSKRSDGNMAFKYGERKEVLENRTNFLDKAGATLENCVMMGVEHKDGIVHVIESDRGKGMTSREDAITGDALVTTDKGLVLTLMTADCFPVAFYDPTQEVTALAHVGRRPAMLQLPEKVVSFLSDQHRSRPEDLIVSIGPGIRKESYIFNADEIHQQIEPEWQPFLEHRSDGSTGVNLLGYIVEQLKSCGVLTEHMSISEVDTGNSDEYFSYYRATRGNADSGAFMTILGMK